MTEENELQKLADHVTTIIKAAGFQIADTDLNRPWGGFYRLSNSDAEVFAKTYFPDTEFENYDNMSPKFLLVAPHMRLSWQYHYRRAELWKVLEGPVGVKTSQDDTEPEAVRELAAGETVEFGAEVRHRLIGLGDWGLVAEIWKHVGDEPSNEDDIVRVQDDFKR